MGPRPEISVKILCVGLQTSPGLSQAVGGDPGGESGDREKQGSSKVWRMHVVEADCPGSHPRSATCQVIQPLSASPYSECENSGTHLRVLGNGLRMVPGPEETFRKRQLL